MRWNGRSTTKSSRASSSLSTNFAKNSRSSGAVLANVADEVFHDLLGQIHVALQIAEGHLRLDHPELVGVPRGVRVLRAEGRAEGVNLRQRAGEGFGLELAADREVGRPREKILARNRSSPSLVARRILRIERRDAKHFARAFAVARGDDRRVDVNEAALLEKLVNGKGEPAAHAKDRAEQIRARPQMRDLAQELRRVAFLLQRIGFIRRADNLDLVRDNFPACPFPCEATRSPRTTMDAPVLSRWTSA